MRSWKLLELHRDGDIIFREPARIVLGDDVGLTRVEFQCLRYLLVTRNRDFNEVNYLPKLRPNVR